MATAAALELVGLTSLMASTRGRPDIAIALIDGPIARTHAGLAGANIRELSGAPGSACDRARAACDHGTFVAGILACERGGAAPGICPGCTLLVRPIYSEPSRTPGPSATPDELAVAILECIRAGARLINLSSALMPASAIDGRSLKEALDRAASKQVLVVAAAGNQAQLTSSIITNHEWVIPVAASDGSGQPAAYSTLGRSIGRNGLMAPGEGVTSLTANGGTARSRGTSVAAPLVTGAAALLWSRFPAATATRIRYALTARTVRRRIVPPLLDARAACRFLETV
jgi:subtilisin family serine protease